MDRQAENSAEDIRNCLRPQIDAIDELLVVALTGEGAWSGFSSDGSRWLKDNL